MAKIHKLTRGENTIYPATIPQAVVDPANNEKLPVTLAKKAEHGYESNPKTLKSVDDAKADHGYDVEETQKTLKEVDTLVTQNAEDISQLAGEVSVKIKNLVINGDFNSSEGWTVTSQGTIVDGEYVAVTLGSPSWEQNLNASIGDMVYFGGILYTLSGAGVSGTPSIRLIDSVSNSMLSNQTEIPTRVSGIHTVAGDGVLIRMNGQYTGTVNHHFDKIFAINLTETFGKGGEPTKEEFELLLATFGIDYFEGEITITAQEVMQWQLKSIRENRDYAEHGIILTLKGFGTGFIANINVGDIGYSTTQDKLLQKTTEAGNYITYPFSADTLYYYAGVYYRYDGSGLAIEILPKGYAKGFDLIALERGAINNSTGQNQDHDKTIRTVGFVPGGKIYTLPDGLSFRSVVWYDKTTHNRVNNVQPFSTQYSTSADYDYRFVIQKGTAISPTETCNISDTTQFIDVPNLFGLSYNKNYSPIDFDYLKELRDVSALISEINPKGEKATIIERVYAGFDGLVSSFPDIVSKSDAAELVSLSYPQYANLNGEASGDYLATPTYRTYLYKFSFGGSGKKQPILIIGGLHGLEYTAPMNLFLFGKTLCNLASDNAYRLLNYFDIYIVPCLNGYGMYHETRRNANNVDLNRNFPTRFWTRNDPDYTGETAGSEFETQLVMALYNLYSPAVLIDHHAYDITDIPQLYAGCNERKKPIVKEAFVDCAFAFANSLPQYFDNASHDYLRLASRRGVTDSGAGYLATWADENGCLFAAYVEVGSTILYQSGEYNPATSTTFGDNVFSIADCTLWNALMRFAEFSHYNELATI